MVKGIRVLSLFDGISCGMVALERAGIKVDKYVAYEIDENAIKVSKYNYPQIEHKGDVTAADFKQYKDFDLLIGGSPCQNLCGMGDRKGLEGEKSKLFFEFVRALKECKPKYFLLENNASMSKKNKEIISQYMGCEPILINSGDFSAQNRKRLYWTNIPIKEYIPKNIVIRDILENSLPRDNVTNKINKYVFSGDYSGRKIEKTTKNSIRKLNQKSRTIGTCAYDVSSNTGICFKIEDEYYKPNQIEFERLQTLPDNYTSILPIKKAVFSIGNGWTVDVIAHIFSSIPNVEIQGKAKLKFGDLFIFKNHRILYLGAYNRKRMLYNIELKRYKFVDDEWIRKKDVHVIKSYGHDKRCENLRNRGIENANIDTWHRRNPNRYPVFTTKEGCIK